MYDVLGAITEVIKTSDAKDPFSDARVDALIMWLSAFVLDKEKSATLIQKRDDIVDAIMNDDSLKKSHGQNRKIFRENIKIAAECLEELDPFIGIKKKQEVMRVSSEDAKKKAMNFGIFECTAAFAEDKTGTLLPAIKNAVADMEKIEERIKQKQAKLNEVADDG